MNEVWNGPLAVTVGPVQVLIGCSAPPLLRVYVEHAELAEDFALEADRADRGYLSVAVGDGGQCPRLVVTQRYTPAGPGFAPGVLLAPEQSHIFTGAGTRLLGYQARSGRWRRSWVDEAEVGFWGWRRHGDVVVMSAELEVAAWSAGVPVGVHGQ